jgi:spermidine synthase
LEGALGLALPWQTLAQEATPDGRLELRRRGERDFLITLDNRVIMTSAAHRSELALGALAAEACATRRSPRLLLGGLGMAFTLRAALDALSPRAHVIVAELNPAVLSWCRGPLAPLTDSAVFDPRVSVECADVATVIADAPTDHFDSIALDLFSGPRAPRRDDPHYGISALQRMRDTLRTGGVLAVWSEQPDPAFAKLMQRAGFDVSRRRPGRGGLRHAVTLGVRGPDSRGDRRREPAARRRSSWE